MPDLRLKSFRRDDFRLLTTWIPSAESMVQWAGPIFHFPLDLTQADGYLEPTRGPRPARRAFSAVLDSTGEIVGHVDLNDIDLENRRASVCRVLVDPRRRRQGIGTHMLEAVARLAFGSLELHRLQLHVFDFNAPAIACYEKVGFVREGVLRDWIRMPDSYWSVIVMGLLQTDWKGRHVE